MYRDIRSRSNKSGDRHRNRLYGFGAAGGHNGNVSTTVMGTDAFQEADIISITMPITKHSYMVRDVLDLPRIIHEAFYIANTGRKGPVLIDIPKDVTNQRMAYCPADTVQLRGYHGARSRIRQK